MDSSRRRVTDYGYPVRRGAAILTTCLVLVACKDVTVEPAATSETLCQDFFEACINPLLTTPIFVASRGTEVTCAAQGCHNVNSGSGGAFKLYPNAAPGSDEITANFLTAKAFTNIGDPAVSKLLLEPLAGNSSIVGGHGGGDIFDNPSDAGYQEIYYWITNPQSNANEACPALDQYAADTTRRCLATSN